MLTLALIIFVLGTLASWFLIRLSLQLGLMQGVSSEPQHHHTHEGVIPRIGGVGIMAGIGLAFAVCFFLSDWQGDTLIAHMGLFVGAIGAFALGLIDDVKCLGAKLKLLIQISLAVFAYACGLQIDQFGIPFTDVTLSLGWWGLFVTIFWFVALMNLINLIDGLDGLAGGVGLFLMLLLAYLAFDKGTLFIFIFSLGVVGSIVGFLIHNFPPAKVYMGDSGAYLIGYTIAALSLVNSEKGAVVAALIAPVLALALPITDVAFAILRRGIKGLPMFRADRGHIHHRLLRTGLSHRQTVLFLYGISLLALVGGLLAFAEQGRYLPIFIGFAFVIVLLVLRGQQITAASIQAMFTESVQSRQDTRNALVLKNWFLMEVERADSGKSLWSDYHFALKKMGFCEADLVLKGDRRSFFIPETPHNDTELVWVETHELKGEVRGRLTLKAEKENFSGRQFELLADLGVETWVQASARWKQLHGTDLDFQAEASEPNSYRAQKSRNLYRPTY